MTLNWPAGSLGALNGNSWWRNDCSSYSGLWVGGVVDGQSQGIWVCLRYGLWRLVAENTAGHRRAGWSPFINEMAIKHWTYLILHGSFYQNYSLLPLDYIGDCKYIYSTNIYREPTVCQDLGMRSFTLQRESLKMVSSIIRGKERSVFLLAHPQWGSGAQWYEITKARCWRPLLIWNYWHFKHSVFFLCSVSLHVLFLCTPSLPPCIVLIHPPGQSSGVTSPMMPF